MFFVSFCWPWSCLSSDLTISVCPYGIFEFLFVELNWNPVNESAEQQSEKRFCISLRLIILPIFSVDCNLVGHDVDLNLMKAVSTF